MRSFFKFVCVVILILNGAETLRAQDYEILLNRPNRIGEKYRLAATGEDTNRMAISIGNTPVKQQVENISVDLTASLGVLEVNASGKIRKFTLSIEKCLVNTGKGPMPVFSPGSVVTGVSEGPETVFTLNGAPIDPVAAKALGMVASFAASEVSDDDIFGTRDRKRVGDTWEINAEMAARGFKQMLNLTAETEHFKGASSLDAVVKGGSEDYLVISAWLAVDRFVVPLPDGIMIQNGQLKGEFSGRFPANLTRQSPSQSMKLAAWFVGNRAADAKAPEMTIQGLTERRINREIHHLP